MKVTVLGCGRWASFHAWYQATVLKNDVLIWGRDDEIYKEISTTYKNSFLELPKTVNFTTDLRQALDHAEYQIIVISAQAMPQFSASIGEYNPKNKIFVLCMKGIIDATGERLSQVLKRHVDKTNQIAVWVGPGHVQEFVRGVPNVMIVDCKKIKTRVRIVEDFKSPLVRLYKGGNDLIGVEIGAAAKNVLGIIAGMLDASGHECLKGALIARGAYEVASLIVAMGGRKFTAYGLSHLGDYEATLFSKNSCNRRYGESFIRGEKPTYLAEGVATSKALHLLATRHKVDMPICELCYQILHQGKNPKEGMLELFERESGKEFGKKFWV